MLKAIENLLLSAQMIGDVCDFSQNPVQKKKAEAYKSAIGRAKEYLDEGFDEWLVTDALKRRFDYIEKAKTVEELKTIIAEPKPHFDGKKYVTGTYYFPEEEAFKWSLASTKAPLNEAGNARFFELCKYLFVQDARRDTSDGNF